MLTKKMFFIIAVVAMLCMGCNNQLTSTNGDSNITSDGANQSRGYNPNKPTYLEFYDLTNFRGTKRSFTMNGEMGITNFLGSRLDNKVSSFKWVNPPKGYDVVLYNVKYGSGLKFMTNLDVRDLREYGFNNMASSFKVISGSRRDDCYIDLYTGKDFTGRRERYHYKWEIGRLSYMMKNNAESAEVHGDWQFYLYDDNGNFTVVQNSINDLSKIGFSNKATWFNAFGPGRPYVIFYDKWYNGDYRVMEKPTNFYDINFAKRASSVRALRSKVWMSGEGNTRAIQGNDILGRLNNRVETMDYMRAIQYP